MSPALYLGIDTSYYTTSVAVVDAGGRLLADERRPLTVPPGQRGLAPAQAVFAHVQALPDLVEAALAVGRRELAGVAASVAPRPAPGSYLPVFAVGAGCGRSLAAALDLPFVATTHQEGHVAAGLWSAAGPPAERFLAVHLSGGTTELLLVERRGAGFVEQCLGGTRDLYVGQFVDRVGVALGLGFPAGAALEALAAGGEPGVRLPSAVRGLDVSFSGPEAQAQRLLAGDAARPADLALAVFACIARTLEKWLRAGVRATGVYDVLLVGGVAANAVVAARLRRRLSGSGIAVYVTEPRYCTDNAVGVGLLAKNAGSKRG